MDEFIKLAAELIAEAESDSKDVTRAQKIYCILFAVFFFAVLILFGE